MKEYRIKDTDGKTRKAIKIKCLFCKNLAILRLHKRKPKFCSLDCARNKRKESRIKLKCDNCNKSISKPKSKILNSRHGKHFCNRKCKEKAQSLKGNCTAIRPKHYGTSNGKELYRNLIKNKRNPKCKSCGENKRYLLIVHHKDGNRENNKLNNLEIVCGNCHIKRHLKFINNKWCYYCKFLTPRKLLKKL